MATPPPLLALYPLLLLSLLPPQSSPSLPLSSPLPFKLLILSPLIKTYKTQINSNTPPSLLYILSSLKPVNYPPLPTLLYFMHLLHNTY